MAHATDIPLPIARNTAPTGAVHHVATNSKVYAPTFDCCATCTKKFGVANKAIDYLTQNKVKATFFLTGEWMMAHPDATRRIIANENFEVGFHGFSHSDFAAASTNPKVMAHEINATRDVYKALVKDMYTKGDLSKAAYERRMTANLFRFPSGNFNDAALASVRKEGLIPIQWNATADGTTRPQLHTGERLEGSIHLAHANMSNGGVQKTDVTFSEFHTNMASKGYQAVTVSELMKSGTVVYTQTPHSLTARDHANILRNDQGNARHGYGLHSYQQFMASMNLHSGRGAPIQTNTPRA